MFTAFSRGGALVVASMLAAVFTFYPPALAQLSHGLLILVIWGMCAGFVYGVGFDPVSPFWRTLLGPFSAWLLMGLGLVIIAKPYVIAGG